MKKCLLLIISLLAGSALLKAEGEKRHEDFAKKVCAKLATEFSFNDQQKDKCKEVVKKVKAKLKGKKEAFKTKRDLRQKKY